MLPVNMVLDPDITLPAAPIGYQPTYGENDLLYIAGGRDGLWVMQADVTAAAQPNLAFRVDDATLASGLNPAQDSRRWCSDVDLITLGTAPTEKTYLLALFAAKDDSELRMYDLQRVRNVAQSGLETGAEIAADTKTLLGRHPSIGTGQNLFSFAFGMDVDDVTKRVYLAMGYHGLARVKMKDMPPYPFAQWGPYFGDGSEYALQIDQYLYGHIKYYESGEISVEHPPLFLDVAVDSRGTGKHWVWAAADHVGVVGFNLEAAGGWSDFIYGTGGSDFHQEGITRVDGGVPPQPAKHWSQLVPGSPEHVMAFARRVQVIESDAALLCTTTPVPFLITPGPRNMGRHLAYDLSHLGGLPVCPFTDEVKTDTGYTIAYDLANYQNLVSGQINADAVVPIGRDVYAPEIQDPTSLTFFAGRHAPAGGFRMPDAERGIPDDHNTARIDYIGNWPPASGTILGLGDATTKYERKGVDRPGRWTYRASLNQADPRILVTTSNEGGLPPDGPLVLDLGDAGGAKIEANFTTGDLDLDADCTQGMSYEPSAAVSVGNFEYRFAYRHYGGTEASLHGPLWRFTRTSKGQNITEEYPLGQPPREEKEIFFTMPTDKFDQTGKYYYMGGAYCEAYANDKEENLLFVCARETPGGIWVLDFDKLIDAINDRNGFTTLNGEHYPLEDDTAPWDTVVKGELTAHPEFWGIKDFRFYSNETDAQNFLSKNGLDSRVFVWPPQFTKLPSTESGPADTWTLVVPSMYAACPEDLPVFANHTGWEPDQVFWEGAGLNKMMVRFFDIEDSGLIGRAGATHVGSNMLPGQTLLGPDAESSAMFLRSFWIPGVGGADRCFCAVADMGGHVQVFETTGILQTPPDHGPSDLGYLHFGGTTGVSQAFATYDAIDDLSDHFPPNIYDVEVDQASWTEDGSPRNETYLYVSVHGVGIQILRFNVNATTIEGRLVEVELIQTPGEVAFLHLAGWIDDPNVSSPWYDEFDHVKDKLLFVGDAFAGFRIYTYSF